MWRRLLALPAADRSLLLEAGWRLVGLRLLLWLAPRVAVGGAADAAGPPAAGPSGPSVAKRVAWAVGAVARRLPAPFRGCLAQGLAVRAMLRRRQIAARLVIGVRRGRAGPIEAHAWVESGGRVIVGGLDDLPSFAPLDPPAGAALASAARHG